ncbi:CsbD family protein [Fructobacillus sp. M158]|uniref:CsbD family protein n=1 Tax=Fructobacillus parabroussonetiae TaxID=2713174 RepID=UPI00200A8DD4|nr:CsbD family protein [Fructobacillus parabroussonetiae]MCK8617571.1 CsbD family protein [Fructobacillus parabroussonetiae]
MKNVLLGISLVGNVILGHKLLEKTGVLDEAKNRLSATQDSVKGQVNQEVGKATGDSSQEVKGMFQEGVGTVKNNVEDLKNNF